MRAKTFDDDRQVEVDIVSGPNGLGLCKVLAGKRVLVRHVSRLEPLDDAAKKLFEEFSVKS